MPRQRMLKLGLLPFTLRIRFKKSAVVTFWVRRSSHEKSPTVGFVLLSIPRKECGLDILIIARAVGIGIDAVFPEAMLSEDEASEMVRRMGDITPCLLNMVAVQSKSRYDRRIGTTSGVSTDDLSNSLLRRGYA